MVFVFAVQMVDNLKCAFTSIQTTILLCIFRSSDRPWLIERFSCSFCDADPGTGFLMLSLYIYMDTPVKFDRCLLYYPLSVGNFHDIMLISESQEMILGLDP
jgi:hypothetical protein